MSSAPPAPWSFAARAAYFGDRVCPFCDHRNPVGARFCNDCSSQLDLKPCKQCDAVNHQSATNCYKCGAALRTLFTTTEATQALPAAELAAASVMPGDAGVAARLTQPLFDVEALQGGWRLIAFTTILIAGAYAAYRIGEVTSDAMEAASQLLPADKHNASTSAPTVTVAAPSKPEQSEAAVAIQAPVPGTDSEAPERASVRQHPMTAPAARRASAPQRPVPVPATKRASARPVPEQQLPAGATAPAVQTLAAAPVAAPVVEARKAQRPDRWQEMHASLARCDGNLIARIVCDQRVRRRYCEGHWGEGPECASAAIDRGQ
jgi:ribosomal protein L40E